MSRLTDDSIRHPGREYVAPELRDRGWFLNPREMMKRFIMGLLGSCLFSAIMFFVQVKAFIAIILAAILAFLGWGVHPPKDVETQGKDAYAQIEKKVKDHIPPATGDHSPSTGVPRIALPTPSPLHKSPEQLKAEAELKEAERHRKEESERKSVMAELESLGGPFDREGSIEKLRIELKEAKEMRRKKPLLERADKLGLHVDPKDTYDVIEKQVKEAEDDASYQEAMRQYERNLEWRNELLRTGPNSRCPNPRCHYQFRSERKNGNYICPRCRGVFPITQAKACMPPPPMPLMPKRPSGILDRLKKGVLGR